MKKIDADLASPRRLTMFCGAVAVLLGLSYLWAAGAPPQYFVINVLACFIGLAVYAMVRLAGSSDGHCEVTIIVLTGLLVLSTVVGSTVEGATRWIKLGPLFVQPSLILLPPLIVAFARRITPLSTLAVVVATITVASQPDRAMVAVAFIGLAVIAATRAGRSTLFAAGVAALGLAYTFVVPDNLPAAPYVRWDPLQLILGPPLGRSRSLDGFVAPHRPRIGRLVRRPGGTCLISNLRCGLGDCPRSCWIGQLPHSFGWIWRERNPRLRPGRCRPSADHRESATRTIRTARTF